MRAIIFCVALLTGCSFQDPTAEDFARAKSYCERNGMKVHIVAPLLPGTRELRCIRADDGMGSVSVPDEVLRAAAAPPEGK